MTTINRFTALATATLLAVTVLSGCAPTGGFDPGAIGKTAKPSVSATSTPTAVPLGGVLTKDAALTLRQDMAANGDFAYAMPDGTWVKTNRFQLLPAAVVAIQQAKVDTMVKPSGSSMHDSTNGLSAAAAFTGQYAYATGKRLAYISQQLQASASGSSNVMTWTVIGPGLSGKGQPSEAAAQKFAAQQIAAQSNPANWDILVKR